jgi:hypothetical protein
MKHLPALLFLAVLFPSFAWAAPAAAEAPRSAENLTLAQAERMAAEPH